LRQRCSRREFGDAALTLGELAQLLWAAQGITHGDGFRTAPSAGALYPLEVYVVAGRIQDLDSGVYKYHPRAHQLTGIKQEDIRPALAAAALEQSCISEGAAVLVFSAVVERTTRKYGQRGIRYVHMEAGHAAQNVFLQATALGIAAVVVGAFDDAQIQQIMAMAEGEHALYLMPIGRPQQRRH
jgi:SagB-type dehydrogenase family enzyme